MNNVKSCGKSRKFLNSLILFFIIMQSSTVGYQSDEVLVVVFQQFLAHLIIVLPMCGMFDSGSDYFVVDKIRYIFSLIT